MDSSRRASPSACKALLVLVVFLATLPAWAVLPRGPKHDTHQTIERLEESFRIAALNNDVATLDRMLAEDYTSITASGMIETKAQVLENRRSGKIHLTSFEVSDRKIRIYGDTAVVTSKAEIAGTNGDHEISGVFRYTRVYNRNKSGQWKIVSFEASRIHDPNDRR